MELVSEIELRSGRFHHDQANSSALTWGPLDRRLGWNPGMSRVPCATCNAREGCVGHFGFIRLPLPIFHFQFIDQVRAILNIICKVKKGEEERNERIREKERKERSKRLMFLSLSLSFSIVVEFCLILENR
jgi:DNA-directed RNA polymerase III subunit RPC1